MEGTTQNELMRWAIQVGGPMAALLLVSGYFYRKDMKYYADQYREDMKYYTDQMKRMSDEMMRVHSDVIGLVKENTQAFSVCTAVVQSLHTHLERGERRASARGETP